MCVFELVVCFFRDHKAKKNNKEFFILSSFSFRVWWRNLGFMRVVAAKKDTLLLTHYLNLKMLSPKLSTRAQQKKPFKDGSVRSSCVMNVLGGCFVRYKAKYMPELFNLGRFSVLFYRQNLGFMRLVAWKIETLGLALNNQSLKVLACVVSKGQQKTRARRGSFRVGNQVAGMCGSFRNSGSRKPTPKWLGVGEFWTLFLRLSTQKMDKIARHSQILWLHVNAPARFKGGRWARWAALTNHPVFLLEQVGRSIWGRQKQGNLHLPTFGVRWLHQSLFDAICSQLNLNVHNCHQLISNAFVWRQVVSAVAQCRHLMPDGYEWSHLATSVAVWIILTPFGVIW